MSDDLIWQVVKRNNSKAVKRTHPFSKMTIEKGTLRNQRIPCDSGFARSKAIDVTANDEGIPVLSIKNTDPADARKPDKMWRAVTLSGGVRKAVSHTEKLLEHYPVGVKKTALRKVSAIYKAQSRMSKGYDHNVFKPTVEAQ